MLAAAQESPRSRAAATASLSLASLFAVARWIEDCFVVVPPQAPSSRQAQPTATTRNRPITMKRIADVLGFRAGSLIREGNKPGDPEAENNDRQPGIRTESQDATLTADDDPRRVDRRQRNSERRDPAVQTPALGNTGEPAIRSAIRKRQT